MAKTGASYRLDTRRLDNLIATTEKQLDAYGRGVAQEMVNDVKLSIQETSPGRTEIRYSPKRTVTVSMEGDAPNTDLGALINSIGWRAVGRLMYWIHDGVEYGHTLEEVYNRPFIQPVFEEWRRKLPDDARKHGIIKP